MNTFTCTFVNPATRYELLNNLTNKMQMAKKKKKIVFFFLFVWIRWQGGFVEFIPLMIFPKDLIFYQICSEIALENYSLLSQMNNLLVED